ncbi:hypothetical protein EVAR_49671_1 [Eumeta japonica]|uniref:Uncharacterized protein n=1 Tax=Eumeta variegata TaxID=151549 RepID=A0A4C1WTX1_EUMVA|nr:hypothetical protein EVAR_49671_1 [Eumeta japonica]
MKRSRLERILKAFSYLPDADRKILRYLAKPCRLPVKKKSINLLNVRTYNIIGRAPAQRSAALAQAEIIAASPASHFMSAPCFWRISSGHNNAISARRPRSQQVSLSHPSLISE